MVPLRLEVKYYHFPLKAHNAGDATGLLRFRLSSQRRISIYSGTDHSQPVMILSEVHVKGSYPYQRFIIYEIPRKGRGINTLKTSA